MIFIQPWLVSPSITPLHRSHLKWYFPSTSPRYLLHRTFKYFLVQGQQILTSMKCSFLLYLWKQAVEHKPVRSYWETIRTSSHAICLSEQHRNSSTHLKKCDFCYRDWIWTNDFPGMSRTNCQTVLLCNISPSLMNCRSSKRKIHKIVSQRAEAGNGGYKENSHAIKRTIVLRDGVEPPALAVKHRGKPAFSSSRKRNI